MRARVSQRERCIISKIAVPSHGADCTTFRASKKKTQIAERIRFVEKRSARSGRPIALEFPRLAPPPILSKCRESDRRAVCFHYRVPARVIAETKDSRAARCNNNTARVHGKHNGALTRARLTTRELLIVSQIRFAMRETEGRAGAQPRWRDAPPN